MGNYKQLGSDFMKEKKAEKTDERKAEQTARFHELYLQLAAAITNIEAINIPLIESMLVELCVLFRLCKAETFLYNSLEDEKQGKGERLCCYDRGDGEPVASFRIVSSIMTVGKIIAYMKPGVTPLSDDERSQMELVMRTVLTFVSRNRIKNVVEMLAFYDDAGYRNLRSLQRHYRNAYQTGLLNRLAVIRYNMRHFSLINRDLGRTNADTALWNHYKLIEEKVGKDGIVCRLDGDNFFAVCRKENLDEVLSCLNDTQIIYDNQDGRTVEMSASAGVFVILFICEAVSRLLFAGHKNGENGLKTIACQMVGFVSYASMACYMFHRFFYWAAEKMWNPSDTSVKWLFMAGCVYPVIVALSYVIQKLYDNILNHNISSSYR